LIGERKDFTLPDGSVITLNTNSLIETDFDARQRTLVLKRGEASFNVAHDADRPFAVHAIDNTVTALGTVFHLQITDGNHVELVVTDGQVIVDLLVASGASAQKPAQTSRAPILVSAGEEFTIGADDEVARPIDPADVQVRLSWRQGKLIFRGETMEQAVREIGRYTSDEFVIADQSLRQEPVGGVFLAGDVAKMLEDLQNNFNVRYHRIGDHRVLLSRE
jgi:transmembrane sensor